MNRMLDTHTFNKIVIEWPIPPSNTDMHANESKFRHAYTFSFRIEREFPRHRNNVKVTTHISILSNDRNNIMSRRGERIHSSTAKRMKEKHMMRKK